ncbi:replication protein A 70 kDa DNA-binding subunit-like, partial [Temnothorax americanus]|uniref:replication protein A 70 kDa DNA-binding subunit-like n=1 Tax=Temnothorax americanus TaxID=1964332 RepID=UPI0040687DEC
RVTTKSPCRTWSNSRGEGKLFSMDLIDGSGEIRCIAFKDLCDKFYNRIEPGKVYYISRCTLKLANKQFNMLDNPYEMVMTTDTEIVPCHEDSADIPTLRFNFCAYKSSRKRRKK